MINYFKQKVRLLTNYRKEPYLLLYKILGFYPKNIDLFDLALLHKSTAMKNTDGRFMNNERLEFLGDAILGAVVSDVIYHQFENKREGFLTNTRSKIVQRESLNRIALEIGIDKLIISATKSNPQNNNICGNAFEALIGAIYLDQGYEKCSKFIVKRVLQKYIDLQKIAFKEVNFKSKLIEWSQKYKVEVVFEVIEEYITQDNNPVFQTHLLINSQSAGTGTGNSKKESQQNASKLALKKIKEYPSFWEQSDTYVSEEENTSPNTTTE